MELSIVLFAGIGAVAALLLMLQQAPAPVETAPSSGSGDVVEMPSRPNARPIRHLDRPILEARRLRKVLPAPDGAPGDQLVVLRDASLALYPGEVVCLSGPAGRGKSTLLRILALEDRATGGELVIAGLRMSELAGAERDDVRAAFIHYIPQKNLGLLARTPIENIAHLLMRLDGLSAGDATSRAEAALEAAGLPPEKFRQRLSEIRFSGGQQARVAVAAAIARCKPITLADEVFANLDEAAAISLIERFSVLARQRQATVVIVAHNERLWPHFDRRLHVGRIDEEVSKQAKTA